MILVNSSLRLLNSQEILEMLIALAIRMLATQRYSKKICASKHMQNLPKVQENTSSARKVQV